MSTKNDASFSGKLFPDSPLGLQKPRSRSPLYALQAPFPDKSPLTDYKWQFLKRKIDEIQPLYFRSTRDTGEGNISVFNESPATFELSNKDFTVYYDTDAEEGFQREKDVFAYRIRVFVSTDGNKIKEAYEACGQANDNEICFFIEDNTDDYSNARLYALFGKSVDKNILSQLLKESNDLSRYLNSVPDINANILRELIEKGVIVYPAGIIKSLVIGITSMTKFVTIIGKGVGWLVETLGNGILEYLSIPETVWNTDSDEYFFQKDKLIDLLSISPQTLLRIEQTLLPKGKNPVLDHLSPTFMGENFMKVSGALEGFIEQYNGFVRKKVEEIIAIATVADISYPISEVFAFLCGLWNGLVDFIGGTLKFIGHLLQMPYDIFDDIDSALETFDNICQGLRNLWNNIGDAFSQMYETFLEYLKKQDGNDINPDKVAYITGFGVAFVASLFVPVAQLARVAKFSKVGKSMLPANFLDDITIGIGKGVDYLKDTSRAAANSARKAIDEMVVLMMLGADKFRKTIKDLIEKIFAWINKNKKLVSSVDDIDSVILSFVKLLQENPVFVKAISLVLGKHGRHYGQWISVELEAMIKLYTANTYIRLNKALRGIDNVKLDEELNAMRKVLDDALDKLPVSEYNNGTLQRSANFTEQEIKRFFKEGSEFVEKGFMSTTHSEKALLQWMSDNPTHNVIFKIHGKNGKLIEKASMLPMENEVLFKSATKFVVERVIKVDHPIDKSKMITEIILKEI